MDRRDLLRAVGAAAALTMLPSTAEAAWSTLAATPGVGLRVLTASDAAAIGALADTWFPRTDTPSATDVGVVAWVDVVLAGYYSADEKKAFDDGMTAMDALQRNGSLPGAPYSATACTAMFDRLEKADRRADMAARGYWRLKGLILHGYFTSERVQKEVLKNEIMPGRYEGAAPHIVRAR
jgi:hypothetical protein